MALTINNPRYGNIFVVADTFAELRTVSSKQIQNGYSAIVAGDLDPGDGFGASRAPSRILPVATPSAASTSPKR